MTSIMVGWVKQSWAGFNVPLDTFWCWWSSEPITWLTQNTQPSQPITWLILTKLNRTTMSMSLTHCTKMSPIQQEKPQTMFNFDCQFKTF